MTVPSGFSAMLWLQPAAICVTATTFVGTVVAPAVLSPQAVTAPPISQASGNPLELQSLAAPEAISSESQMPLSLQS